MDEYKYKKLQLAKTLCLQFLIALCIHTVFAAIIVHSEAAYSGIERSTIEPHWISFDTPSYVNPAKKYIVDFEKNGIFGPPNRYRTMGYPALIALTMKLSPDNWIKILIYFQAIVAALAYPAISVISRILFNSKIRHLNVLFAFLLLSGAYLSRVGFVLTDLVFAVFLYVGIACAFLSIAKRSWLWVIPQVIFIGGASLIRPTLYLYPILHLVVLCVLAGKYFHDKETPKIKYITLVLLPAVFIACVASIPTIRGYKHFGIVAPSQVLAVNLFNITGRYVLQKEGREDLYNDYCELIDGEPDDASRYRKKIDCALEIYTQYPYRTFRTMSGSSAKMMAATHWLPVFHCWNLDWWYFSSNGRGRSQNSLFVKYFVLAFSMIYLTIYSAFIWFLWQLLKAKKYLFLLLVIMIVSYLLLPTFIAGGGGRLRLPAEGIIAICAIHQLCQWFDEKFSKKEKRLST
ncbi:MAG: hypothetical protein KAS23_14025 [Anaerohalosphaera sp.]|nr:hypothetical protein [Anaerohalosphaera sp.]